MAEVTKTSLVITVGGFVDQAPAVPSLFVTPYNELLAHVRKGYFAIDDADTKVGAFSDKISAGSGITLTVSADGAGGKTIEISASSSGGDTAKVDANDSTPGFLDGKFVDGDTTTVTAIGGNATDKTIKTEVNFTYKSPVRQRGTNILEIAGNIGQFGRLSLSSSDALPSTASGNTVYWHPFYGNVITGYTASTEWVGRLMPDPILSVAIASTANKNYDIYLTWNAGTEAFALATHQWSTDTIRDTGVIAPYTIVKDGGVWRATEDSSIHFGILLGTVRTDGSGVVQDSLRQRFVQNVYNQEERRVWATESDVTTSSYGTQAWRAWNGDTSNRVEIVDGLQIRDIDFEVWGLPTSNFGRIGIGLNSSATNSADISGGENGKMLPALWRGRAPQLGYNEFYLLEYADAGGANVTFNYDKTDGKQNLGARGYVMA